MAKLSLCVWEGDLFGDVAPSPQSDWNYGTMYPKLWSNLPKEVLKMILFTKIPDSSKCRFRAVSRQWRQWLSSPRAFLNSKSSDFSSRRLMCKMFWNAGTDGAYYRPSMSCKEGMLSEVTAPIGPTQWFTEGHRELQCCMLFSPHPEAVLAI